MENIIIKSLFNEIERLQAQINDQKQTIFELGDEVDTIRAICHDQSETIEKCSEQLQSLEELQDFKKSANETIADLLKDVNYLTNDKRLLNEDAKDLNKEIKQLESEVDELRLKLAESRSKVKEMIKIKHLIVWLLTDPDSVEQTVDGGVHAVELVKFVNGKRETKTVTHDELKKLGDVIPWINDIEIIRVDEKTQSEKVTAHETGCWD